MTIVGNGWPDVNGWFLGRDASRFIRCSKQIRWRRSKDSTTEFTKNHEGSRRFFGAEFCLFLNVEVSFAHGMITPAVEGPVSPCGSVVLRELRGKSLAVSRRVRALKVIGLALPFLFLVPAASNAALMSAQDLATACSGDAAARATCNGYLMATTDAVLLKESRGRGNGKACVPPTVTIDQVRDAVLSVAEHRRVAQAPVGVTLVTRALRATWPCDAAPKQQ
jgi:Rap1a immunity proteins